MKWLIRFTPFDWVRLQHLLNGQQHAIERRQAEGVGEIRLSYMNGNRWNHRGLEHPRQTLGFVSQKRAEDQPWSSARFSVMACSGT
ncbi:MAG: hypothetical protein KF893_19530 [Caldilineaceae bacterium]|nr:hypothetical protein [Caldilineaceae bacterium]